MLICVVLLTAYFGESPSSPLHRVQRGIVAVVSPIQDGASKVLSPVRNVSDWVSTTLRAKSENGQLRKQVDSLTALNAQYKQAFIENPELRAEIKLDRTIGAANYHPVAASVIGRDSSFWYQQVEINAGSGDGIKAGDPVLAGKALVGKISQVTSSGSSIVVLITQHTVQVAAEVQDKHGATGVLAPAVGNPDELLLQNLPNRGTVIPGQLVVTAGFKDPANPSQPGSLYPPGIPIGRVSAFSQNELLNQGQVPVAPLASVRRFTSVQVLTKPYAPAANVEASVP